MNIYRVDGVKLTDVEKVCILDSICDILSKHVLMSDKFKFGETFKIKCEFIKHILMNENLVEHTSTIDSRLCLMSTEDLNEYMSTIDIKLTENVECIIEFNKEETLDIANSYNKNQEVLSIYDRYKNEILNIDYENDENDWTALSDVVFYQGLTPIIQSWKTLSPNIICIQCPNEYNSTKYNVDLKDLAQLQIFWMIAVLKFGDYGTSPRYGWIDNEHIDEFYNWCDLMCYTELSNSYECVSISIPDNLS